LKGEFALPIRVLTLVTAASVGYYASEIAIFNHQHTRPVVL